VRSSNIIQFAPRTSAVNEEPPDLLIPALAKLRACNDSMDTLILIDSLPDLLLPSLAWAASRKPYIKGDVVQAVVTYCGPLFLERVLGKSNARQLLMRYPKRAAWANRNVR
jgi:hypothetical protein